MFSSSKKLSEESKPIPMNPQELTNEIVQAIGNNYLAKHPEPTFPCCHTNQKAASILKACNRNTYEERWHYLTDAYRELDKPDGTLATEIERCFKSIEQFIGKLPAKYEEGRSLGSFESDTRLYYTSAQYADMLKTLITPHLQQHPTQSSKTTAKK